jgi:uncharacterized repeat protein (TIGR03803 family)
MRSRKVSIFHALGCIVALWMLAPPAQAGGYKLLYTFQGGSDGANPQFNLVKYKGDLYGTTNFGGAYGYGAVIKITPKTGAESAIYSFTGGSDGAFPTGIIMDRAGNIYGTASAGGSASCAGYAGPGCGTVFKLAPDGTLTVLYSFQGSPADGNLPNAAVIMDMNGNLFGTTAAGGSGACNFLGVTGRGTVFEIPAHSNETVLYSFQGGTADGAAPLAAVIADAGGNLYGTTLAGGNVAGTGPCNNYGDAGCGTAFELSPQGGAWSERVLYFFCSLKDCTDGAEPVLVAPVLDAHGDLLGTTQYGGKDNCCGTVFKLSPQQGGNFSESVVYSFCSKKHCADGSLPQYGLIADSSGNFYSSTATGGLYDGGTAFKLAPDGTETVLHSFAAGNDGNEPDSLTLDSRGHLYGGSYTGGANNVGIVFELRQ